MNNVRINDHKQKIFMTQERKISINSFFCKKNMEINLILFEIQSAQINQNKQNYMTIILHTLH